MSQVKLEESCSSMPVDPSSFHPNHPPYFDRFLGILLEGDAISDSETSMKTFDKQVLTSMHEKSGLCLTNPDARKFFPIHVRPEQEQEARDEGIEAADELVPLNLEDLKKGERNECAVLYGVLCVEAFQFGRIYTLLEEAETGKAVALSIVSPEASSIDQSFARNDYPKGRKIAVKEPMLVQLEGGLVFVEVDNPFTVEKLGSLPSPADINVRLGTEKFSYWMDCATEAYESKEWERCNKYLTKCEIIYSKGTRVDEDVVVDMYGRRWESNMYLRKYAEALRDAEKCCVLDPMHIGGVKSKLQSLLSVGRYQDAYRLLERSRGLDHFQDDDKEELLSIYRGLGKTYFDFGDAIIGGAAGDGSPRLSKQDGDFIGPVEIRMTNNGNGRGLFATENIQAGDVVLISKALAISHMPMRDPTENGLFQNVKDALSSCGDKALQLFLSHAACIPNHLLQVVPKMSDFINESAQENDLPSATNKNVCTITIHGKYDHLIHHILERIALDDSSPAAIQENGSLKVILSTVARRLYYGVWLLASFINHSCVPNAARMNVGIVMRIHATKPIENGQEITIPYFRALMPYSFRKAFCKAFGFVCVCKRCEVEKKILQSEPKAKKLCLDYLSACKSRIKDRVSALNVLVDKVEFFLELLKNRQLLRDEESEAWIRSSFMAAYFARIAYRKQNLENKLITQHMCDDNDLLTAGSSLRQTSPGDVQVFRFFQSRFLFWRDLARNDYAGHSESWTVLRNFYKDILKSSYEMMQEICLFVHGQQREGVLHRLLRVGKEMENVILQIILRHIPEAKLIESGEKGSYRIRLPFFLNEMEGCRRLKKDLKDSFAKPTCFNCHSVTTQFRNFVNSSSKVLHARYMCLACHKLFTLGGEKYAKGHPASNEPKKKNLGLEGESSEESECPIDYFKEEQFLQKPYVVQYMHRSGKNDVPIDLKLRMGQYPHANV